VEFEALRLAMERADVALREGETRYRTLFDAAPFGVIVIDPATHEVLDVNGRACAEYGYTREEFLRLTIADIDALGDSEAIRARARVRVVRPGVQEFEAQHRAKSGAVRDVLVRVQGVRLGGRDVTYGAHFDITARKAAEAALALAKERLEVVLRGGDLGTWHWNVRTGAVEFNERWAAMLGYRLDEIEPHDTAWERLLHPGDRQRVLAALDAHVQGRMPSYESEYRLRHKDGRWVWVLARGRVVERDAAGRPLVATGTHLDITARKAAEERQALLMREVDHRAKNALAVVQSMLRLTPAEEPRAFAAAVEARVAALARAHSLLAEEGWAGADLRAIAERELAPYAAGPGRGATAVSLEGPAVPLSPAAVQPIAMVLHELAANAIKHGALSRPGGRIELRWAAGRRSGEDGMLRLTWRERGGPAVPGAPARRGFGSRVIEATVRGQLGGTIERRWEHEGLTCLIEVPLARVAADEVATREAAASPA
jgi:PAS domain S-box-containing protein